MPKRYTGGQVTYVKIFNILSYWGIKTKTMWNQHPHIRIAKIQKKNQTPNTDEDVEQEKFSFTASANVKCIWHMIEK